ncbi:hypothetical protein H257_15593 [Aphanomyces astaci]|uniref:Proline-rich protein PRCC n=1 Tax=Aphanomyces astaci TaxID=112090 RepID=W4FLS4_APHAT|nr:hypothetical protein H257_15593 [Aphanomyces astaci]ETV68430.1 hypothetical protein H257_15593 [Aphanomyces astaci]|eukprot:XP_009842056.1 hypothetical protein H257_15593 [Aphanomyces astaci]
MSLVADYGSDSDSDGSPVVPKTAAPATSAQQASDAPLTRGPAISIFPDKPPVKSSIPHKPTSSAGPPKKKAKKTLHLPPEIQKLLESGRALNSDDDSDTDTKKQPAAVRKQSTATKPPTDALLSFLPPPKVALPVRQEPPHSKRHASLPEATPLPATPVSSSAAAPPAYNDPKYSFVAEHDADDYGHGKRRRNHERNLERLLQQGKFDAVAGKITEVKAAAPEAWQPPIDGRGYAHDREAQVLASMAGTETEGGYVIASYKPSRLQRQRHQLNQLTFDAKLREFDLMDSKSQMVKSKKETQAKYGW